MKRTAILALALFAIVAVNAAGAASRNASLQIRHQLRGCHSWSLNGGPYKVHQSLQLARGGTLLVTNDDLMAQDLIKTSGPAVTMRLVRQSHMGDMHVTMPMGGKASPYVMAHMGAQLRVTFTKAGSYRFKLVDRGDYVEVETKGPDNELTLTVVVP